ncbi:hypothetical protein GCM10009772_25140 [Pseudonocardia alni subsp. carboxydivorans]|uniref:Uncharacterized protein n=1 Tax=Pseudonocardia alni subsp. carboxydivorans TaxID=415010 RepID=A0ABU9ALA5_PSEA5
MSARPTTAELVHAGLHRAGETRRVVTARYQRGAITPVQWRTALAHSHAREARWWGVLARVAVQDHSVPLIYIAAVAAAQGAALNDAAHWADSARDHARTTTSARVA